MAYTFLSPISLSKLEIQNAAAQSLAADPSTPVAGQFYFNTATKRLRVYDGTSVWVEMGSGGGSVTSVGLALPTSQFDITNSPVTGTGTLTGAFKAGSDLANMTAISTTGILARTAGAAGAASFAVRTISNGTGVTVTNGDGVSGNPSIAIGQAVATTDSPTFVNVTISTMGTNTTHAATKGYVDGLVQGIKWKNSVRGATAAAGTLASSFANGSVIDTNVTLATGDRILIKDQAAPAENGIYTVNASGAPTRTTDMDAWTEVPSATVLVELGSANADTSWVCTSDQGGTINVTAIAFVKMANSIGQVALGSQVTGTLPTGNGGTGTATAGTQYGLVYYSTTTGMASTAAGTTTGVLHGNAAGAPSFSQIVNADITNSTIDLAAKVTGTLPAGNGGTGNAFFSVSGPASTVKTYTFPNQNTSIPGKFAASFGDNTKTAWTTTAGIAHGLGTADIIVQFYAVATGQRVEIDYTADATYINFTLAVAPTTNQYRVVAVG